MTLLAESRLPLPLLRRGKVREVYEVDAEHLLLVASDRVSAFDVVMREPVPRKGAVLTQISAFWFERLADVVPSHFVTARHRRDPRGACPPLRPATRRRSPGRADAGAADRPGAVRVRGARLPLRLGLGGVPATRARSPGEPLPAGLVESDRLEPPIFSPATKAETGHDLNVTFDRVAAALGAALAGAAARGQLRGLPRRAATTPAARGIIIADTKFEFGTDDGGALRLIDEVMTPDSSRFWPADRYEPGRTPAELRQAAAARLPRRPQAPRAAGTARRRRRRCRGRGRGDQPALPRGVPPAHRPRPGAARMIRTAPEGKPFIVGAWAIAVAARGWPARQGSAWCGGSAAVAWLAVAVWVVAFFRDPERAWSRGRPARRRAGGRQGGERHSRPTSRPSSAAARSGSRSS